MGCGSCAAWMKPLRALAEQGGLFLGPGDRDPEVGIRVVAERGAGQTVENFRDVTVRNGFGFDDSDIGRVFARGNELERSYAIASQAGQE